VFPLAPTIPTPQNGTGPGNPINLNLGKVVVSNGVVSNGVVNSELFNPAGNQFGDQVQNKLHSLVISNVPLNFVLSDGPGGHTFTALDPNSSNNSVDVTGWDLADLAVTPPATFPEATFQLTITATEQDNDTSSSVGGGAQISAPTVITETVSVTGEVVIDTPNPLVNSGTLEVPSGEMLEIDVNVTNAGVIIQVDDGGALELVSDTVTGGAITLNASTHASTLQIEGTVTLDGVTLTLSDSANNSIVSTHDEVSGAAMLINKGTI